MTDARYGAAAAHVGGSVGTRGLWFTTNPTSDTVTIHISSPRTVATTIAWLLLG